MGRAAKASGLAAKVGFGLLPRPSLCSSKLLTALLAALLLAACTTLGDGQQQVIYVPTPDGVEAQTVHVGSPPLRNSEVEGPIAIDPEASHRDARAALLSNSMRVEYLGEYSEALFLRSDRLVGMIGFGLTEDYEESESLCQIWADHAQKTSDVGAIEGCNDRLLDVDLWQNGRWSRPSDEYHTIAYQFELLRTHCDQHVGLVPNENCISVPLNHRPISPRRFPICAVVRVHVFQLPYGRQFRLVESTDPVVYGLGEEIDALSDPEQSIHVFGEDYSELKTKAECEEFFGSRTE